MAVLDFRVNNFIVVLFAYELNSGETIMIAILTQVTQRIGSPILGVIIPAAIFTISFVVAYLLYKHFTRKLKN